MKKCNTLYAWKTQPAFPKRPRLACRLLILCMLASIRACDWMVEQPSSSTFVHFPYLRYLKKVFKNNIPIEMERLSQGLFSYLLITYYWNQFVLQLVMTWLSTKLDGTFWRKIPKADRGCWNTVWDSYYLKWMEIPGITLSHRFDIQVFSSSWFLESRVYLQGGGCPSSTSHWQRVWRKSSSCLQRVLLSKPRWRMVKRQCLDLSLIRCFYIYVLHMFERELIHFHS